MKLPSISIVSISYNTSLDIFKKTLEAVASQEYPKSQIEHIIVEAGSTNGSIELAKKYHTKVIVRKDLLEKPLVRMSLAIRQAKNELVLFLEPDNIMIGKKWLKQMVQPFMDDKKMVASFSMHNAYEPNMPVFTRYCALFGINDPIVYYLNKSEKIPLFEDHYSRGKILYTSHTYTSVEFDEKNLPTLGDNGHMVRRSLINMVNKNSNTFLHTDAFSKLVRQGCNRFAAIHNSIIHHTGSSITNYYFRRIQYKQRYFDLVRNSRTYLVFDKNSTTDQKNLLLYIFYSLTFIQPLILSIRGFMVIPEMAWFLHPVVCFLGVFAYGYSEIRSTVYRVQNK